MQNPAGAATSPRPALSSIARHCVKRVRAWPQGVSPLQAIRSGSTSPQSHPDLLAQRTRSVSHCQILFPVHEGCEQLQPCQRPSALWVNHKTASKGSLNVFPVHGHRPGYDTKKTDDSLVLLINERSNGTVKPRILEKKLPKILFQARRMGVCLALQELPVQLRDSWNVILNKGSYSSHSTRLTLPEQSDGIAADPCPQANKAICHILPWRDSGPPTPAPRN